jgi:hypothetical protein
MATPPILLPIATITKNRSSQLRISISRWREQSAIEMQEYSAAVPAMFGPTPSKVTLDIDRLPELIVALKAAETEGRQLGLLPAEDA